ncbi:replication protein [Intestinirhabdus alba]|jgi:phage replication O-like protein O|uniref:Replication protein n=1 Tax=Intestinirhabdus alba TaxID=2899544 RepID=A0A6L6IL04_9ENTR|nr:replication protein [Intestinirhabdus alba]MTH45393.1 replication protein [Intestinirhabdus alba]
MSNVAYAEFGAVKAPVERKVAELEDGYAKLSNMLLEAYAGADLTKRQFKVLLAILRKTYGWNKAMDRISDSQISEIAKLPVKRCNETKLQLVRMGLIKQQGGMFGPNKNITEWRIPQNEGIPLKIGDKTSLKLRDSYPSKQGDTKDTIQNKEIQDKKTLPEQVQTMEEKPSQPSNKHQATDEAFENIFWLAGMCKTGKKNAKSAFRTQYQEWRRANGGTADQFASFLAGDISSRMGKQFGFEKLYPATYLNCKRWEDEKPTADPESSGKKPAVTVSKSGYVYF